MTIRLAIFFLCASALLAQSTSTITGQIKDATDAAMPKVRVLVRAIDTRIEHQTTTNAEGYYTVPSLPPIEHQVTAEFEGFKKASSEVFKLDASSIVRINLTMHPQDAKQSVDVSAAAPIIDTQDSAVGITVTEKELTSLPLNGRNTLELALTVPGVSGEAGSDEGGIFVNVPATGSGLSLAGGRTGGSAILADGANSTSVGLGRATVTFSPDTIQEIRVITSTFSAQYGVSGGGVISTVSKSGTNELHGSAFWFTRNPAVQARAFNSILPPSLRRQEVGTTVSGPVWMPRVYNGRSRTFFFFSFEPKRWTDATAQYTRVPTPEERQGDFRKSWAASGAAFPLLYQQVRCIPSESECRQLAPLNRTSTATPYPLFNAGNPDLAGRVIPKQYLDPVAQDILNDVPLPNMAYDSNGNNYFGARGVIGKDNRWNLKIDHNASSKNRLSVRYSNIPNVADRYRFDKSNLYLSNPTDRSITRQILLSDSHTVTSRIVNELRASYTYSDYSRFAPADLATTNYTRDRFGLPSQTSFGYPYFNIGSGFAPVGLTNGNPIGTFIEHQYQISDDVTMSFGKHTITTGLDLRLPMMNVKATGLQDACCGAYTFNATATNSGNANTPGGTGGHSLASFLMGLPSGGVQLRGLVIPYYYRWKLAAGYFQDDYKMRSNLTLNLGLRWQYTSPRSEKFGRQASLDIDHPVAVNNPNGSVSNYVFDYLFTGFEGRSIYLEQPRKRNFEPRFGFAWTPKFGWTRRRTMVVRGGYGISHGPNTSRGRTPLPDFGAGNSGTWNYVQWTGSGTQPQTQTASPSSLVTLGRNPPVVTVDPRNLALPPNGRLCSGCVPQDARVPSSGTAFASNNQVPYIQTWNLTTQAQLPGNLALSLSYLGQKGTHLYTPRININNPDPIQLEALLNAGIDPNESVIDPFGRFDTSGNLRTVRRQDLIRPYPTLGDVNVVGITNGLSIYHAGSVSLDRRFQGGAGFRFNYTWGKSIDTNSDAGLDQLEFYIWGIGRVQNPLDIKANRSVSMFDSRHRFNLTANWELPFGRKKRFLGGAPRPVRELVSDWQLNAVSSLYSGYPFSPFLGDANGVPGGVSGNLRVFSDIVPGVPIINPRWSKSAANDVPYFNPEAFARPKYGELGNSPRTLDWGRNPWKPGLNASLFREIRPFENRRRYLQLRTEFFNVLNHATFTTNPNSSPAMFGTGVPVSRTGLDLSGPIPYFIDRPANSWPTGSREAILAQNYVAGFGKFDRNNNGSGRLIQFALKLFW